MKPGSFGHALVALGLLRWSVTWKSWIFGVGGCFVLVAGSNGLEAIVGPSNPFIFLIAWFLKVSYFLLSFMLAIRPIYAGAVGLSSAVAGQHYFVQRGAYTLPLTTRSLVWAPIVIAFGFYASSWGVYVLAFRPSFHGSFEAIWPLLFGLTVLSATSALAWIAACVPSTAGFPMIPLFLQVFTVISPPIRNLPFPHEIHESFVATMLSLIAVGLGIASWVAPKARNGFRVLGLRPAPVNATSVEETQWRPFRSMLDAQLWFSINPKGRALILPLVFQLAFLSFMFLPTLMNGMIRVNVQMPSEWTGLPTSLWNIRSNIGSVNMLAWLPFYLLIGGLHRFGQIARGAASLVAGLTLFEVSRPVSTASLVSNRCRLAVLYALIISPPLLVMLSYLLTRPAVENGNSGTLGELIAAHMGERAPLLLVLLLLCLPIFVWSFLAGNPFAAREFRIISFTFFVGLFFATAWVTFLPIGGLPLKPGVHSDAPAQITLAAAWTILVVKFAFACEGIRRIRIKGLLSKSRLASYTALWFGALLLLTSAFDYALPAGHVATWTLALIIALFLPANRYLWLLISLDIARHDVSGPTGWFEKTFAPRQFPGVAR